MTKNILLTALSLTITALSFGQYRIYLKNETVKFTEQSNGFKQQLNKLDEFDGYRYGVVQFEDVLTEDQKQNLLNNGVEVIKYVPDYAYFCKISSSANTNLLTDVTGIRRLESKNRLHEDLLEKPYPAHALEKDDIKLNVAVYSNQDLGSLLAELDEWNAQVQRIDAYTDVVNVKLPVERLEDLANLAIVEFIEPIDAPGEPENYRGRSSHRVASLDRGYTGLSIDLDGSGMHVMLQDDGVIGPHIDYQGRIGAQYISTDRGNHGDHTGGTIMGGGNLNPKHRGMAPSATIYVYGAAWEGYPGFDSIYNHYNTHDIHITSTSYSNGTNAGYTTLAKKLDDQVERMSDLVHVFSAGNAGSGGWYTITGGHKVAKNVVTVANLTYLDNVANSSSRGPARDGRIKPDIGAVGTQVTSTIQGNQYQAQTGTSMSCPGVAGTITVLSQAYKNKNNGAYPDVALVKGIICNTADDIGNAGPDFSYGFGRINARKAYDMITNKTYFSDSISNGDSVIIPLNVPAGISKMKVMLSWADPQASAGASKPLINDLDIYVTDGGSVHYPLVLDPNDPSKVAVEKKDDINNIEQVVIDRPSQSAYQAIVKGSTVPQGPQVFYVTYIMEKEEIVVEYPNGGEKFNPGETETIRWSAPNGAGPFEIEISTDSGTTWTSIAQNISATLYNWTVGTTNTNKALIRISDMNHAGVSNAVFNIFRVPPKPSVSKVCPDSVTLAWGSAFGADHYVVYELGEKYMDSIGVSSGLTYQFSNGVCGGYEPGWYAVEARGANGEIGRRSEAFYFTGELINCPLDNDLSVLSIAPDLKELKECVYPNGVFAEVEVENSGVVNSDPFTVNISANGGAPISESLTVQMAPGTSTHLTFKNALPLNPGANDIKIWVSSVKDENVCNDSLNLDSYWDTRNPLRACELADFDEFDNCSTASNCEEDMCDLEDGWVNAQNGVSDEIDWRTNSGRTPTRNTGPNFDHTTTSNVGKYVYLETSGGCNGFEAQLLSPCYDLTNSVMPEFNFWYHMYGNSMGTLNLDVKVDTGWVTGIMPELSGNKGNNWFEQKVDLSPYIGQVVQFRFRGVTGGSFYSDMALDDIQLLDTVIANFTYTSTSAVVDFNNTSTAVDSVVWDFGDGKGSSDVSPSHTYADEGWYLVTLEVFADCGSHKVTQYVYAGNSTSVAEQSEEVKFSVFPQPARNQLQIRSDKSIQAVSLIDLSGKQVLNKTGMDSKEAVLNTQKLNSGIYILEISSEGMTFRRKVEITD